MQRNAKLPSTLVPFSRKAVMVRAPLLSAQLHDFTRSLSKLDFDNAAAFQLQKPASGRGLAKASFTPAKARSDCI
jgi:hypothetical protein